MTVRTARPRSTTPLTRAAATAALLLTLAACAGGGDADAGSPVATASASTTSEVFAEHNDADVEFAQMMIVHHRGAVEMAGLAADRTDTPQVLDLAERIAAAQGPEIDTMSTWLEAWGAEVPADDSMAGTDHGGMDHGGGHGEGHGDDAAMPGAMTDEQMAELGSAEGEAFDEAFLTMMIEHHEGAIAMAQDETDDGENVQALELAATIARDQATEIAEMEALLGR